MACRIPIKMMLAALLALGAAACTHPGGQGLMVPYSGGGGAIGGGGGGGGMGGGMSRNVPSSHVGMDSGSGGGAGGGY